MITNNIYIYMKGGIIMKDVIMTFKTTDVMRDTLKQIAKMKDMSVSAIIRQSIELWLKENYNR